MRQTPRRGPIADMGPRSAGSVNERGLGRRRLDGKAADARHRARRGAARAAPGGRLDDPFGRRDRGGGRRGGGPPRGRERCVAARSLRRRTARHRRCAVLPPHRRGGAGRAADDRWARCHAAGALRRGGAGRSQTAAAGARAGAGDLRADRSRSARLLLLARAARGADAARRHRHGDRADLRRAAADALHPLRASGPAHDDRRVADHRADELPDRLHHRPAGRLLLPPLRRRHLTSSTWSGC